MSNITGADQQLQQKSIQQNAGVVASETPNYSAQSVQYQISQIGVSQQSGNQSAAHIQAANAQQSYPNSMPGQQAAILKPPNVGDNFATDQHSDNMLNSNMLPPTATVPVTTTTTTTTTTAAQQNPPLLPQQQPAIQPLLSPEPDQGDTSGNNNTVDISSIEVPNNNQQEPKSQQQTSPQKTLVTKVRLSDELNIFDWFRTTDIINQIAEKAKSSVDSVITALDPGMKEYLYSGGNINILVISENDTFVSPIRDVFQTVFGRATVASAKTSSQQGTTTATSFPIKLAHGFNEAIRVAQERIKQLRLDTSRVPQNQVIIAVQPSIVHVIDGDSENSTHGLRIDESLFAGSYLTYCLVLEDPVLGLTLTSYSQCVPLDNEAMSTLSSNKLAEDSPYYNLGYIIPIDELMNSRLKLTPEEGQECQWLERWAGLDIIQLVRDLSSTSAHLYRRKWTHCVS